MDVAQMLLCYQEVVQKVSCVVSWVPPRGFVVLGCFWWNSGWSGGFLVDFVVLGCSDGILDGLVGVWWIL